MRRAAPCSSVEALRRFSSGDLQSECDEGEVDPYTGRPATTSQPKPQGPRPASQSKIIFIFSYNCVCVKIINYIYSMMESKNEWTTERIDRYVTDFGHFVFWSLCIRHDGFMTVLKSFRCFFEVVI